jgi:SpoVK/Ycf46/Vps4 family AAA+-type ATPase
MMQGGYRHTPTRGLSELAASAALVERLRDLIQAIRTREHRRVVALFTDSSGPDRTLAVEAVAAELGTDVFHVDLSRLVSKYIGETEKNLERVFEEAERASAVLFLDEADVLFSKRSEVRDAGDRYANLKIDYLLQRIEEHSGVVILTTNVRPDVEEVFVPHLDLIIEGT